MTDKRPYPHFRADLVGYMLTHESTPAQVATYLAADGRASLLEIGNLRASKDWAEASRRVVGPRFANCEEPSDMMWHPDGWVRRDAMTQSAHELAKSYAWEVVDG